VTLRTSYFTTSLIFALGLTACSNSSNPSMMNPDSGGGFCGNGIVDVGEDCDDGNPTNGDGCDDDCSFSCTSDAACDDGATCNGAETCNLATHQCQAGTAAADGTECGVGMQCQSGACVTTCSDDLDCQAVDPCLGAQTCNLDINICEGTALDDGAECDLDGEPGICLGGACSESMCGDGFVDEAAGEQCEPPSMGACTATCVLGCVYDTDCDDGDPCNGTGTCTETQVCDVSASLDDGADCGGGNVCLAGACITPACTGNVDCNSACFGGATCNLQTFTCEGGTALWNGTPCGGGNVCIDGECVAPECVDDPDCPTEGDVCVNGVCITPECTQQAHCPDDGNICNGINFCNTATYSCEASDPFADGTPCDFGGMPPAIWTCQAGQCVAP
jgi:hypothetical protein